MNSISRNIKTLLSEDKVTFRLYFLVNKASKKLKTKEFIYEVDWDSMPGSHTIIMAKTHLTLPPNYASDFSNDNFDQLNKLGLVELINHDRNETEGTDKYYYKLK